MSPPATPSSSLKRNLESTYEDESPSKRARVHFKADTVTKRQLVPVVSRRETSAELQRLQGLHDAAPGSGGDNDFIVAKANVPSYGDESGLSNWRSDDMEPPSSFMNDEAEDGLFPALGGMSSYALNEEDLEYAAQPQYGQEGIDDGGEAYQLDADGLPIMDDEPVPEAVPEPQLEPVTTEAVGEEDKKPVVVYDLDDSDDDEDMDAFIAEANGTQTFRPPIVPSKDTETESAESSDVVEAPARAPQVGRVQNLNGVVELVTSDGQIDQFIIDTGATPAPEEPAQRKGKERADVQPRDAEVDELDVQIIDQNDSALAQSFKTQGYHYQHSAKRATTPPLPTSIMATLGSQTAAQSYNVNKTSASTAAQRAQELAKLAGSDGPVAGRDNCKVLNLYHAFWFKAINLIPDLPHWKEFEWTRRYWIAVLYTTKKPNGASKVKDFMWMKGIYTSPNHPHPPTFSY